MPVLVTWVRTPGSEACATIVGLMRASALQETRTPSARSQATVYAELARPGMARTTVLRRLLRLSAAVYFHPYWVTPAPTAGRAELPGLVRAEREHGRREA